MNPIKLTITPRWISDTQYCKYLYVGDICIALYSSCQNVKDGKFRYKTCWINNDHSEESLYADSEDQAKQKCIDELDEFIKALTGTLS